MTGQPWAVKDSETVQPTWTYRQEPAQRTSSIETDVWVLILQSAFVALAWGILVVIGTVAPVIVCWSTGHCVWPWWVPVLGGLATWAGVFAWLVTATVKERRELLWRREEREHRDIDGDGHVGEPEAVTLQVELVRRNESGGVDQIRFVDLGVSPEKAAALARGVLGGRALSEAEWTGQGRPFSRREFRNLRGELLEAGLVNWRNPEAPAQGVELTPTGRAVFQRVAQQ